MRQKIRQNCVKNASKMRGTPLGENTLNFGRYRRLSKSNGGHPQRVGTNFGVFVPI